MLQFLKILLGAELLSTLISIYNIGDNILDVINLLFCDMPLWVYTIQFFVGVLVLNVVKRIESQYGCITTKKGFLQAVIQFVKNLKQYLRK